jgi:aspartyl-tRNA(Asn)/glutamyl-tRNA(Gln) amidotransferase subunit A
LTVSITLDRDSGAPTSTVPCGFDGEGLPIGIELEGRHWAESTPLAVTHAYQEATDRHRSRAPLAA